MNLKKGMKLNMSKTKDIKENIREDMKEDTRENSKREIEEDIKIDEILRFESLTDAEKFEEFAKGRMFCKRGEKLQDICEDELENYVCKNSKNFLLKWYLHRKTKKNKGQMLIESRLISVTRAIVVNILDKEEIEDREELVKKVRGTILDKAKQYRKQLSERKQAIKK